MALTFDANYYLSARPDVFNAFVKANGSTGLTWAQFAENHYNTFGRFEGSNPNSVFNTTEYLTANPDVAAAGVNPFQHFLTFGVNEGRSPNASFPTFASFDSATYLSSNPDLAAAGITTKAQAWAHFVVYGEFEGRPGAPVVDNGIAGSTFTLTTGVDAPGASAPAVNTDGGTGNDTYNAFLVNDGTAAAAAGSTLQTSDLINAGAGTDTLAITVTGSAGALAQALPVTSGLEKIAVRNVAAAGSSVTLDATLAAGLTEVGNTSSTAAVAFTGVGSNTTVRVADSAAATSVTFADKVFQAGGTAAISVKNAGTATTDAQITLATTGTAGTATTLAIAAEGKNFIDLNGGATDIGAAGGIKTVTVSGSGTVDLDDTSELATNTLAADLTKLDASANTGGVTATVSNTKVAVTGGAGSDVITVAGGLVEGASINLGAGNDSLLFGTGGSIATKVSVDGGAGIDAVSTAFINAGNGSQFLNFERLDLATSGTLDASLLTGSTITDLVLSGAGGSTINNVKAGVDLIVSNKATPTGTTTINVADATKAGNASDVFDINFAGAAVSGAAATAANVKAGTIALAGVETVNIASDGDANTWNSITLTDNAAKVVNITGAKNLDLAVTAQTFAAPATDEALTTINGSAATGKLSIAVNGNFDGSITGGSAADIITVSSKATTLTGGAGNDEFQVGAADVGAGGAATPVITTITDFTKGDKIDFGAATAFQTTKVNVGAATDLASALELAADATGQSISWFQFGNDTYIVSEDAAGTLDTIDTADTVVKLVGLHDLSTSTLTTNDLTFA